ncbi:MAG: prenyltransferase [Actinobacteria bacterium]|nr:prenyltransferase [Actinomycetota bacterium]
MSVEVDTKLLGYVEKGFAHAVIAYVDDDGYPLSVATGYRVEPERGEIHLDAVSDEVAPPEGRELNVIFSHIRPQENVGYDERRYVSMWGRLTRATDGYDFRPERAQSWDEQNVPFFQYSEITVPQAHAYLEDLGTRQGRRIKPRLDRGWLLLRATRLPFLSATVVPVGLGTAIAGLHGAWHWWAFLLAFFGAAFVHLGLNVANDVFDTMSGADHANTTPTQFSGGSRVAVYGLLSVRQLVLMSAGFYAAAIAIGLFLAVDRGFWPLFWIGLAGVVISVAYTAPPFRLVHRGVGEIAVAAGFGPIMVLGAFYVQAQRLTAEAWFASIPVAILIALVLYVNEIPDRTGDAAAGKRTLPVRWSREAVIRAYALATAATYGLIAGGAVSGLLPRPTIIALATIPMATKVRRGLEEHYDNPYALMPTMGTGVNLHLATGMLMIVGYVVAIIAAHTMGHAPLLLR